jgi:hypothetical protein
MRVGSNSQAKSRVAPLFGTGARKSISTVLVVELRVSRIQSRLAEFWPPCRMDETEFTPLKYEEPVLSL